MTDNEIIKALECISGEDKNWDYSKCPFDHAMCTMFVAEASLDLINRQKAEIKRLRAEAKMVDKRLEKLDKPLAEIRAEAITEFEDRLEEEAYGNDLYDRDSYGVYAVTLEEIRQIAKELKGEAK